jgi:hypothetical protein
MFSEHANHCLKVAMSADQFALPLSVKVPVNDPVEVTTIDSLPAFEPAAFFCRRVNPVPTAWVPE